MSTADLAGRADFSLGQAVIAPSTREIRTRRGKVDVEPRVMQVLVVLADAAGQVVTREALFDRCWGTAYVGEDSLNRAIAALRRAIDAVGAGIAIHTIPRTGYRLTADGRASPVHSPRAKTPARRGLGRREIIGGGAAAAAVAAAGSAWWFTTRADRRFEQLIAGAEDAILRHDTDEKTVALLQQAIAMRPNSAKAWGLLALVRNFLVPGDDSRPNDVARAVEEAESTARKALSLDPSEPNALLAMFELQGSTLDWITRDRKLRQIIARAPQNLTALIELTLLTAATGLVKESWDWNERVLALDPLDRLALGMRSMKLWVFGRMAEADKVIDQLRALYPDDPWVWFVRVQLYAFTRRVPAAIGLLDAAPPGQLSASLSQLWRASLPALETPTPARVRTAREAAIKAVEASPVATNEAVLLMSALGELDTAFAIADATLIARGPLVQRAETAAAPTRSALWRTATQWMWAPPVAAMRADPRFLPLCAEVGLTDYWGIRGVKPDYLSTGK